MELLIGTVSGVTGSGGEALLADTRVNHLAGGNGAWWGVDDQARIWRDGEEVAATPPDVTFNCITPTSSGVWVGADRARLFVLDGDQLTEDQGFAAAPHRDTWHTPWGGPPDVRSMSYAPDGVLYVNVHVGGILRYDDTGLAPTLDIEADVHQVLAHPDRPSSVVAATAWGLARTDNGHDFEFHTEGLAYHYCRAVAVSGDTVVLSASRGPRGGESRLYRGSIDGGPMEICRQGLPAVGFDGNLDTHCLVAGDGQFFAGNGSTVWRSADQGRNWQTLADHLPRITCLAVVADSAP